MKSLKSIVFIGWMLLLISIIMDDLTTHILFKFGFKILETNPVYQLIGNGVVYLILSILMYIFIGWAWYYIVEKYRKKYKNREKFFKFYDIFVFLFCFILVFVIVTKISAGVANIDTITYYFTEEGKQILDHNLQQIEEFKINNPVEYQKVTAEYYKDNALKVSYWKMILMMLGSYLLFKTEMRVAPSDLE